MKSLLINIIALSSFFLTKSTVAQEKYAFNTAGKTPSGVMFSVGEQVATKLTGSEVILYQGFIMPIVVGAPSLPAQQRPMGLPNITEQFWIGPNPVNSGSIVRIEGAVFSASGKRTVKLWTGSGKLLSLSADWNEASQRLEVTMNVPAGLYLMRVETDTGPVLRKLLVR